MEEVERKAGMLRVIVFLCGAALMGLELVAARVLAPSMGNSIYVWGSVISSVMVALSLGYWIGGRSADRWGASRLLPMVIAGASFATVLVPPVAAAVVPWAADFGPRLGALVASAVIFFVPSLMLAMVSPIGVRLAATSGIEHIGRSAGGLYAVSTAGSIVGTIGTAFWLIPLLSLDPLIVWTGFLLAGTALAALALRAADEPATTASVGRLAVAAVPAVAVLVVASLAAGGLILATSGSVGDRNEFGETVLFDEDTQYHHVTVTEDEYVRHLRFDRTHQSAIYLDDPFASAVRYTDYLHLALAAKPDAERVLVIGLGGGTLPKQLWRDHPEMRIDVAEIDPVVIDVAETYFGLPDDERIRVFAEDGRRYVQRTDETYDIVVVDAYYADGLPFHLTTREFFEEVGSVLAEDGVVAYNLISAVEGSRSDLFRSMYRTALDVWPQVMVFPIDWESAGGADLRRNVCVLGVAEPVERAELLGRIAERVGGTVESAPGFAAFGDDLYDGLVELADVPLLTDDYAPTDSLIELE